MICSSYLNEYSDIPDKLVFIKIKEDRISTIIRIAGPNPDVDQCIRELMTIYPTSKYYTCSTIIKSEHYKKIIDVYYNNIIISD